MSTVIKQPYKNHLDIRSGDTSVSNKYTGNCNNELLTSARKRCQSQVRLSALKREVRGRAKDVQ